jgi:hypothetical protein
MLTTITSQIESRRAIDHSAMRSSSQEVRLGRAEAGREVGGAALPAASGCAASCWAGDSAATEGSGASPLSTFSP